MNTRVARSQAAILDAAAALLFEGGPAAVTIDAIVARSGVAKTTIYRHWATRDELVAGLFVHLMPRIEPLDPSLGFEEGLRSLLRSTAMMMRDTHWRQLVSSLLTLRLRHPEMADIEHRMLEQQSEVFEQLFQRGIAEGRLSADDDPHVLLAFVVGPLLMVALGNAMPPSDAFADQVADHFLAAQRLRH